MTKRMEKAVMNYKWVVEHCRTEDEVSEAANSFSDTVHGAWKWDMINSKEQKELLEQCSEIAMKQLRKIFFE